MFVSVVQCELNAYVQLNLLRYIISVSQSTLSILYSHSISIHVQMWAIHSLGSIHLTARLSKLKQTLAGWDVLLSGTIGPLVALCMSMPIGLHYIL